MHNCRNGPENNVSGCFFFCVGLAHKGHTHSDILDVASEFVRVHVVLLRGLRTPRRPSPVLTVTQIFPLLGSRDTK